MAYVRAALAHTAQHMQMARRMAQSVSQAQLFCLQRIPCSGLLCPWELRVWAASGEAIVPNAKNDIVMGHNACTDLWGDA